MAKLKDDPKVQELVQKESDKAAAAAVKACLATTKSFFDGLIEEAKTAGDKAKAKDLSEKKKSLLGLFKS